MQELTDVNFERDMAVPEQAQLRSLLTQFVENEMRSCSMDVCGITPLYVYRMWGDQVPLNEIEKALRFQDSRLTKLTFDATRHN